MLSESQFSSPLVGTRGDSWDNNARETTIPKFMHLVRHGISTMFESLPCQSCSTADLVEFICSAGPN